MESQVVQTDLDRIEVRAVLRSEFDDEQRRSLLAGLMACLGSDMTIEIKRVNDIPRTRTGKFRFVVSEVDHPIHSKRYLDDR